MQQGMYALCATKSWFTIRQTSLSNDSTWNTFLVRGWIMNRVIYNTTVVSATGEELVHNDRKEYVKDAIPAYHFRLSV